MSQNRTGANSSAPGEGASAPAGAIMTSEPARTARRPTRTVRIGRLKIGSEHPILIQSMTTADTLDTGEVVREIARLVAAGCPLVRLTVPNMKAAENLPSVRHELGRRGIDVPLVADVHFTPDVAIASADFVEKVRINPGNYADRKRFELREFTDTQYAEELERVRVAFAPLVQKLIERGIPLRVGANHGSLSDRIMSRFGDTPEGMVESALEFVRICESLGFREIVLSMKSSIPSVMIAANRLLVRRMTDEQMDYPIHLGVTEAGMGIDGRVKSAIGIGSLLLDGIGDTVRVSLTEDPEFEVEACERILFAAKRLAGWDVGSWATPQDAPLSRRATRPFMIDSLACGGAAPPCVEGRIGTPPWGPGGPERTVDEAFEMISPADPVAPTAVAEIVSLTFPPCDNPSGRIDSFARFADTLRARGPHVPLLMEWDLRAPREIHAIEPFLPWLSAVGARVGAPERGGSEKLALLARLAARKGKPLRLRIERELRPGSEPEIGSGGKPEPDPGIEPEPSPGIEPGIDARSKHVPDSAAAAVPIPAKGEDEARLWPARAAESARAHARTCLREGCEAVAMLVAGPGIIHAARAIASYLDEDETTRGIPIFLELPCEPVEAAVAGGSVLLDGIGDGVCIPGILTSPLTGPDGELPIDPVRLAYTILQGCRFRLTRAEFIACPSCGRTQFDLQATTNRIREKTEHLSGIKIAIMGCVVNGPGEMADADFGYVGSAPGRIDLYVGRTRVRQAIREEEAVERLIDLIREHGKWIDPPAEGN